MTQREKLELIKAEALKSGAKIMEREPLSKHTTIRVGGACDIMIFAPDAKSAARLYFKCKDISLYTMILGNGSNCLFSDDGFRGAVIVPGVGKPGISVNGNVISATAGALLINVCKAAQKAGLSGMEFAYGIPGTVGGAVFMNAGAYGGEIKNVVKSVTAMGNDGKPRVFTAGELEFGYRSSIFERSGEMILDAEFELMPGDPDKIREKMEELMSRRKSRQPLEYPSFGSAFKRPEGTYAGLVIEQSGLKGARFGGAQISEKHANFIINLGGATASDIISLIERAQNEVLNKTGFSLEPEVKLIPSEG